MTRGTKEVNRCVEILLKDIGISRECIVYDYIRDTIKLIIDRYKYKVLPINMNQDIYIDIARRYRITKNTVYSCIKDTLVLTRENFFRDQVYEIYSDLLDNDLRTPPVRDFLLRSANYIYKKANVIAEV